MDSPHVVVERRAFGWVGCFLFTKALWKLLSHRYLETRRREDVCMMEKSFYQGRVCELDVGLIRIGESCGDTGCVAKDGDLERS